MIHKKLKIKKKDKQWSDSNSKGQENFSIGSYISMQM